MRAAGLTIDLSPLPILDAFANYGGEIVDLDGGCVVSAAALRAGQQILIRRLQLAGVEAGDRVLVAVGNGPQFIATLTAVLACDGSLLLLHAKTPPAELKRTAMRYGAMLVVTDEFSAAELSAELGGDVFSVSLDWAELLAVRIDTNRPGFCRDYIDLPAVPLHPTSGTTGQPKVAIRPGPAATEEARHYIETIGVTAHDTIVAVPPMCHAYAYGMCVMVPLLSGARIVSMRTFQASRVFQALAEQPVTILPAVPAMLDVLLFSGGDRLRGAARCVFSAGSPLTQRTAEQFHVKTGITVRPLYGTTETGGISVASDLDGLVVGGCVGRPMNGVEARVQPLPAGSGAEPGVGVLLIRSSSMMAGYLGHDAIDTSMLEDGWFSTGDLARIDPVGRIHLLGREAEVINVSGMKVVPCEVEEVIAELPGVREVKVYAGQRRTGGQFVKASVVTEPGVEPEMIRAHCQRNLVYYKRPERIYPLASLPRSPAGKILRDQLP